MAFSFLLALFKTLTAILRCLLKRNHRHGHQTRTRRPAHQSVACASTYFRMSVQMEKGGFCQHTTPRKKPREIAPVF